MISALSTPSLIFLVDGQLDECVLENVGGCCDGGGIDVPDGIRTRALLAGAHLAPS